MYRFANQKEVKDGAKFCEIILKELQQELKDYFTFQFTLIGSGGKKLVTQNENGPFDLDYNLVIQKDKKDFINNPKRLNNCLLMLLIIYYLIKLVVINMHQIQLQLLH